MLQHQYKQESQQEKKPQATNCIAHIENPEPETRDILIIDDNRKILDRCLVF